jgi:hypothetical protein
MKFGIDLLLGAPVDKKSNDERQDVPASRLQTASLHCNYDMMGK